MQALSQGMDWSRKVRQQPGLTPGFSLPPQLPEPARAGRGPNLCGRKGISPTETGQALEWVPGGRGTILQDTDVPPSSPRSCSGEGRGAGRQSCAGWRGGDGPSPPSRSSALSQKCSSCTVVGALLLLLSSSSSPSWGFYKTDKGTALGVRR